MDWPHAALDHVSVVRVEQPGPGSSQNWPYAYPPTVIVRISMDDDSPVNTVHLLRAGTEWKAMLIPMAGGDGPRALG
jgi:hypothetical protein